MGRSLGTGSTSLPLQAHRRDPRPRPQQEEGPQVRHQQRNIHDIRFLPLQTGQARQAQARERGQAPCPVSLLPAFPGIH